jgi:hypothetical protein
MKILRINLLIITITIFSSFSRTNICNSEFADIEKLEYNVLKQNIIGKIYTYDLTKRKGCNKTKIQYLGLVKTKNGEKYKVLSSFHVFIASSTCQGTSNIKFYDINNNFIGEYYVGMPNELPEKLVENRLLFWSDSKDCDSRKKFYINLESGIPKSFFLPCSKKGGNEYNFSIK